MKHIFFVHSNVTYLSALSIIDHLNIDTSDVIISKIYSFKIPIDRFQNLNLCVKLQQMTVSKPISERIKNPRINYRKFDDYLNELTNNQEFAIYLPHIGNKDYRIIANHPKCSSVNFMEEGLSAYVHNERVKGNLYKEKTFLNRRKADIIRMLYTAKVVHSYTPKHLYDIYPIRKKQKAGFYGLTTKSFHHLKNENIILLKQIRNLQHNALIPNSSIVILDALAESGYTSFETMKNAVLKIASQLKNESFHIKFHHFQDAKLKEGIIRGMQSHKLNFHIIEDTVIMEDQFLNIANGTLKVHGFISSLLYYAKVAGHEVFSHENLLMNDESYIKLRKQNNYSVIGEMLKEKNTEEKQKP